jgi:4a-hydroxytetrahydrobiopterin dehydratase
MNDIPYASRKCKPCEGGVEPKQDAEIQSVLTHLPEWSFENGELVRTFTFKNYYETMAFVNALAWIAHTEDHHPDIEVSYKTCRVRYSTHAIGGISDNDFICAAKLNGLV